MRRFATSASAEFVLRNPMTDRQLPAHDRVANKPVTVDRPETTRHLTFLREPQDAGSPKLDEGAVAGGRVLTEVQGG